MIFGRVRSLERQRTAAADKTPPGPLRDYLLTPLPEPSTPVESLPLLAIDIETTGLDTSRDHVLAIGWIPVDGEVIDLAGARRVVLRADAEVGQSATIHGLTDDDLAEGVPPVEALGEVLQALAGRVLLAHHASIETDFLAAACRRAFGVPLLTTSVDTLALQHRLVTEGVGAVAEPGPGPCGCGQRGSATGCPATGRTSRSPMRSPAPSSTSRRRPSSRCDRASR